MEFWYALITDVNAKVELDANTYKTLGYAYKLVNKADCNAVGSELSYEQATSLVLMVIITEKSCELLFFATFLIFKSFFY